MVLTFRPATLGILGGGIRRTGEQHTNDLAKVLGAPEAFSSILCTDWLQPIRGATGSGTLHCCRTCQVPGVQARRSLLAMIWRTPSFVDELHWSRSV